MTRKITSILFMSAILFTSAIAASIPMMQDAEAISPGKTGSKVVCGDRLCSEWEGGRAGYEATKLSATTAKFLSVKWDRRFIDLEKKIPSSCLSRMISSWVKDLMRMVNA